MNRLVCWVLGLGLSLLQVAIAAAEEKPRPPESPNPPLPFLDRRFALLTPEMKETLNLTGEQKEKVEKLLKDLEAKYKDIQSKLRDLTEKAKKEKDPDEARRLPEQYRALQESALKQRAEAERKLVAIFTEEQRTQYAALRRTSPFPPLPVPQPPFIGSGGARQFPGQVLSPHLHEMLKLSPEQKAKIAKLQKEAEEKILNVLTAEQKQLDEVKKRAEPPVPPLPER